MLNCAGPAEAKLVRLTDTCVREFANGREFVHTSRSTEVTCRNKIRQSFDINKELFVNPSCYRWLGCRVSCLTEVACWPNGFKGEGFG